MLPPLGEHVNYISQLLSLAYIREQQTYSVEFKTCLHKIQGLFFFIVSYIFTTKTETVQLLVHLANVAI